jgi:uncharacterized membrane protein YfcA
MIAGLGTSELIIVLLTAAAGATVQGSAGIGLGLIASPILLQLDPSFAPGPLLLGGLVIGARHITMEWADLDRPALGRASLGLPFGAIAGLGVLRVIEADTLSLLIGLMICAASLVLLGGLRVRATPASHVATGAAAAFTSITAAIPGPPLVIGFADLEPRAIRCTVSVFVAITGAVAFVGLMAIDRFGRHEAALLATMLPGLVIGVVASRWTRPFLDRHWFRPGVLLLSLAGGAALAINHL